MRINLSALLALVVCASALAGCSAGRPRGDMSDGERLTLARCSSCHVAPDPRERTAAEWGRAVAYMEKLKKVTLDEGERALILSWLASGARPPEAAEATAQVSGVGQGGLGGAPGVAVQR